MWYCLSSKWNTMVFLINFQKCSMSFSLCVYLLIKTRKRHKNWKKCLVRPWINVFYSIFPPKSIYYFLVTFKDKTSLGQHNLFENIFSETTRLSWWNPSANCSVHVQLKTHISSYLQQRHLLQLGKGQIKCLVCWPEKLVSWQGQNLGVFF